MGILVNFVCADEDMVDAIGRSQYPVDEWAGIEVREIDTAKIAMLHCLLTGDGFEDALNAYEPVFANDDDGTIVLRIPGEVVDRLATLDEEALERVGEELAATEEFELNDWPIEEVQGLVMDLSELARLAEAQGEMMFAWMHPLPT